MVPNLSNPPPHTIYTDKNDLILTRVDVKRFTGGNCINFCAFFWFIAAEKKEKEE